MANSHHDTRHETREAHTAGTRRTEKRGHRQAEKPAYIGKIADDEKKYKKKSKKIWKYKKAAVSL